MALYTFHLVVIEPPADLFRSPATTSSAFEKDVFSRQMSVHFGSTSFLRRSIVPTSWSYADSSGGATPPLGVCIRQQSISPPCCSSFWTSESQSRSSFPPNSFYTMAEITPTKTFYLFWKHGTIETQRFSRKPRKAFTSNFVTTFSTQD